MSVCVREGGAYNTPKQAVDLVNYLLEFEIGICWRKLQFQQKTINLEFGDGGGETKVDEERERVRGSGTGKRGREKGREERTVQSVYNIVLLLDPESKLVRTLLMQRVMESLSCTACFSNLSVFIITYTHTHTEQM